MRALDNPMQGKTIPEIPSESQTFMYGRVCSVHPKYLRDHSVYLAKIVNVSAASHINWQKM